MQMKLQKKLHLPSGAPSGVSPSSLRSLWSRSDLFKDWRRSALFKDWSRSDLRSLRNRMEPLLMNGPWSASSMMVETSSSVTMIKRPYWLIVSIWLGLHLFLDNIWDVSSFSKCLLTIFTRRNITSRSFKSKQIQKILPFRKSPFRIIPRKSQ